MTDNQPHAQRMWCQDHRGRVRIARGMAAASVPGSASERRTRTVTACPMDQPLDRVAANVRLDDPGPGRPVHMRRPGDVRDSLTEVTGTERWSARPDDDGVRMRRAYVGRGKTRSGPPKHSTL